MVDERHEWEATKGPLKIQEVGLEAETRNSTPENDDKENQRPPGQVV